MSFSASHRIIEGFLTGGLTTTPAANQVMAVMVALVAGQIRIVGGKTLGSAAQTTIVDLTNNDVSVWKDPAKRLIFQAGTVYTLPLFSMPDHRSVRPGDVLKLVVVQSSNNVGVAATAIIEYPISEP